MEAFRGVLHAKHAARSKTISLLEASSELTENFHEFHVFVAIREFSPRKSIFKQLDTIRTIGHGTLGYCKFTKVFSAKIYFQAICESFLLRKPPPLYCSLKVFRLRPTTHNHGKAIIAENCSLVQA